MFACSVWPVQFGPFTSALQGSSKACIRVYITAFRAYDSHSNKERQLVTMTTIDHYVNSLLYNVDNFCFKYLMVLFRLI